METNETVPTMLACEGDYNDWVLDARLSAAAPDLLAALEGLMEFWDNGTPVHPSAEVVAEARAALALVSK